jgi:hypothetical protein
VASRLIAAAVLTAALLGAAGCGGPSIATSPPTAPPASVGPGAHVSAAVGQTRGELARALGAAGYQVTDPQVPYRAAEAPAFAAAPRAVVQVLLAEDLDAGYVTIYEFASAGEATDAARDQAAYVASGPGRIQFASGARFAIRQVGTTIVFYAWSPGSTDDPRAPGIMPIIEGVGTEIPVPR